MIRNWQEPSTPQQPPRGSNEAPIDEQLARVRAYLCGEIDKDDVLAPEEANQLKGVERLLAARMGVTAAAIATCRALPGSEPDLAIFIIASHINEQWNGAPMKMSAATLGTLLGRHEVTIKRAITRLEENGLLIVRRPSKRRPCWIWAAIPSWWTDARKLEPIFAAALGPAWRRDNGDSASATSNRSGRSTDATTELGSPSSFDFRSSAGATTEIPNPSAGATTKPHGSSAGATGQSRIKVDVVEEGEASTRTDDGFAVVVQARHRERLREIWTQRPRALDHKPPTLDEVTNSIEAAIYAVFARHPNLVSNDVEAHLATAIASCGQAKTNVAAFLRVALLREVEEALKAKRQRVKERTDSSRKAPTAPHRPEVPERWQPVERMIRAHASQAFIARENLQAVITETIAALNEIENVTDADVSALCKDDPIDRADGRVQLWPPESFARALDVLVQARLGAEARAAEDVPPWM